MVVVACKGVGGREVKFSFDVVAGNLIFSFFLMLFLFSFFLLIFFLLLVIM